MNHLSTLAMKLYEQCHENRDDIMGDVRYGAMCTMLQSLLTLVQLASARVVGGDEEPLGDLITTAVDWLDSLPPSEPLVLLDDAADHNDRIDSLSAALADFSGPSPTITYQQWNAAYFGSPVEKVELVEEPAPAEPNKIKVTVRGVNTLMDAIGRAAGSSLEKRTRRDATTDDLNRKLAEKYGNRGRYESY